LRYGAEPLYEPPQVASQPPAQPGERRFWDYVALFVILVTIAVLSQILP
jgi:hypothetical protein